MGTKYEIHKNGLGRIVPRRRHKKGPTPGLTNPELTSRKLSKDGIKKLDKEIEEGKKIKKGETMSVWTKVPDDMTDTEKRKLLALTLKLGVMEIMSNHVFEFGGSTFLQKDGGSIGLRMTGTIAQIVMDSWAKKMKISMESNGIKSYLFTKYVDDVNMYVETIRKGSRWIGGKNGKVEYKVEWEEMDMSKSDSKVTMEVIRDMGEGASSFMKLTYDIEDNHDDGRIPMLDVAIVRTSKNVIRHEFYEKKVAPKRVVLAKSAMPQSTKIAALSQEVMRRLMNTGRKVDIEIRIEILNTFMKKLRRSGYCEKERKEILECGLRGYYKKVEIEIKGGEKVNKDGSMNKGERKIKGLANKTKWHNKKSSNTTDKITKEPERGNKRKDIGQDEIRIKAGTNNTIQNTEAVIFIPYTHRSGLRKRLQAWDDRVTSTQGLPRIRFIERAGCKIKDVICKSNPWANAKCGRDDCQICKNEKQQGKCTKEGITYRIGCMKCKENGINNNYWGESSRSMYERYMEHLKGLDNEEEENALWKHVVNEHGGIKQNFEVEIIRTYMTAMRRQIGEWLLIIEGKK